MFKAKGPNGYLGIRFYWLSGDWDWIADPNNIDVCSWGTREEASAALMEALVGEHLSSFDGYEVIESERIATL